LSITRARARRRTCRTNGWSLRAAFDAMVKDPDFLADANKCNI
jgi:hypothetical protein